MASIVPESGKDGLPVESSVSTATTKSTNTPVPVVTYKIVKVRKLDGTVVRVRRPIPGSVDNAPPPDSVSEKLLSKNTMSKANSDSNKLIIEQNEKSEKSDEEMGKATNPRVVKSQETEKPALKASAQKETVLPSNTASSHPSSNITSENVAPQSRKRLVGRYRVLRRVAMHTVSAMRPDWNIFDVEDDFQEGDEVLSDDDSNSDDADSEDDDRRSDSDQQGTQHPDGTNADSKHHNDEVSKFAKQSTPRGLSSLFKKPIAHPPSSITEKKISSGLADIEEGLPSNKAESKSGVRVEVNEKQVGIENNATTTQPPLRASRVLFRTPMLSQVIVWSIMILFPLFFLVLGICGATLNNHLLDPTFDFKVASFKEALKIAVTTWPIVFAALVAQSLKAFATYRVERGIRLTTLEQLIGSSSVASAIKQPFRLRKIDLTSLILLVLWGFSPLASQALQRMSDTVPGNTVSIIPIRFVDTTTRNRNLSSPGNGIGFPANFTKSTISLFAGAILPRGSQDQLYMDPWAYPLIPAIHLLEQNFGTNDSSGWYNVPQINNSNPNTSFISHIGIPYMPFQEDKYGNWNFSLPSSYFRFSCSDIQKDSLEDIINSTGATFAESITQTLYMDMNINSAPTNVNGNLTFASLITNGSSANPVSTGKFAYSTCDFNQIFVVSNLSCSSAADYLYCQVSSIHKQPVPASLIPLEPFHGYFVDAGTPAIHPGKTSQYSPTLIERYLADPSKLLHEMTALDLVASIKDTATLELRISRLFNTFWQAAFDPMYQTGFYRTPDDNGLDWDAGQNHHNVTTVSINATFTDTSYVFIIHWAWLVTLLVCSTTLLILGVIGALWESQTVGPDILGFANSIVRQSKQIALPKTGVALSGAERMRMMGDMMVMMQDIRPNADVGKIGLGKMSESAAPLRYERVYR